MPRMPHTHCDHAETRNVSNASDNLKLKILEDKLRNDLVPQDLTDLPDAAEVASSDYLYVYDSEQKQAKKIPATDLVNSADLADYATKEDLKSCAEKDHSHDEYLTEHQSLDNYNTKEEVSSLIDRATSDVKEEIDGRGYLTEHQDLSSYALKKELFNKDYNELENKPELFSGNYEDLSNKPIIPNIEGLATEQYVDDKIATINFPETDLTGYYTKSEVDEKVANVKVDLTGYATEEFVNESISKIEIPETDLSDYYTKGAVNELIESIELKEGLAGKDGKDFKYEDFTSEQLEALRGPKGEDGKDGKDGEKGEKGDPGETGLSAYAIWLAQGNVGSEAEFLASFKGLPGEKGERGEQGLPGIQGEKGDKGDKGDKGEDGRGISNILPTDKVGLATTYSIYYTDNTVNTIVIKDGEKGDQGVGIANIQHDRDDADGNCVYTITLTDGRTEEFIAYKGKDGNYSIKIGDNIYTAIEGIIQLPNFLTEHQSLEDYTTKAYVAAEIAKAATEGKVDLTGYATETYVDQKTAALVDSAPETLNTLNELAVAINNHEDAYDALLETVGNKAEKEHTHDQYLTEHQDISHLATKVELPNIDGLASEAYVDEKVAGIEIPEADLSNYYTKSEVYNKEEVNALLPHEEIREVKTTVQTIVPTVEKVEEILPKVEEEILPAVETVAELKAWVDNKNYLQDVDLSRIEEDLRVLENNVGFVKVDDRSFAEVIDETFAKKTEIPSIENLATKEEIKTLDNSIGFIPLDERTMCQVIDDTYATKEAVEEALANIEHPANPTKVSELENDANYTDETKVLELIENNASSKIGFNFITNITVGHLKEGTEITADMTIGQILKNILFCEHEYDIYQDDPTCIDDGCRHYECIKCGYSYEEVIPADPARHSWEEIPYVEPDCTHSGHESGSHCTICGEQVGGEYLPATGHIYGEIPLEAIEPTCTETGLTEGSMCARCQEILVQQQVIPALDHEFVEISRTEASCETDGQIVYRCSRCNEEKTEVIPALGHDYGDWVVIKQPEVGILGEQQKTCKRCGDVITEEIPALQEPEKPSIPGIPEDSVAGTIVANSIPAYSGTTGNGNEEVSFKILDTATANYTDQGFYVTYNEDNEAIASGYQLTMVENTDTDPQTFAVPVEANFVKAYQYDEFGTQTWLEQEWEIYWIPSETVIKVVDGKEVEYQVYTYNVDDIGDAITATEYWRFEIGGNN